jgi:hypothetical protein
VVASEDMRLCHMNGESVVDVIYCDDCLKAKFLDYYHIKILLLLVLNQVFVCLVIYMKNFQNHLVEKSLLDDGSDLQHF